MNFSIDEPRGIEAGMNCSICHYPDQDKAVAVLMVGLNKNLTYSDRLCLRHLNELKTVVDAAVEEFTSE